MKNQTPFILPPDAEAASVQTVLALTSGHALFAANATAQVPFTVPAGFFDAQYAQILANKSTSPRATNANGWALRPALAAVAVACVCLAVSLQPTMPLATYPHQPEGVDEWVLPNSPADLDHLLEESATQTTTTMPTENEPTATSPLDDEAIF